MLLFQQVSRLSFNFLIGKDLLKTNRGLMTTVYVFSCCTDRTPRVAQASRPVRLREAPPPRPVVRLHAITPEPPVRSTLYCVEASCKIDNGFARNTLISLHSKELYGP